MKKCQVHVRLVHRLPCQGWKSTLTQWHDLTHKPVVWPQPQVSHPEDSLPNFAGGCGSEVRYSTHQEEAKQYYAVKIWEIFRSKREKNGKMAE
jgi:hypothetical protein